MFADKFKYPWQAEVLLFKKNLAQLVYTTGKLENLQTSLPDTEAIINNYQVNDVRPETISTILGIKHAFQFIINKNHCLQFNDILAINNLINNGAYGAGKLRDYDVNVYLTTENYYPPIPNSQTVTLVKDIINNQTITATEKAINLNLFLSKQQLFMDGNKRTALIAANDIMLHAQVGMLAIPDNLMHWYGSQLQKYYLYDNNNVKYWLYDHAIIGSDKFKV